MALDRKRMFGLWKESDSHTRYYQEAKLPKLSIFDYLARDMDPEVDAKVLYYLSNGNLLFGARNVAQSILDPSIILTSDRTSITDGTWIWFGNVIHYYKLNSLRLPTEFMETIKNNNFIPPKFDIKTNIKFEEEFMRIINPSQ